MIVLIYGLIMMVFSVPVMVYDLNHAQLYLALSTVPYIA